MYPNLGGGDGDAAHGAVVGAIPPMIMSLLDVMTEPALLTLPFHFERLSDAVVLLAKAHAWMTNHGGVSLIATHIQFSQEVSEKLRNSTLTDYYSFYYKQKTEKYYLKKVTQNPFYIFSFLKL